MKKNISIIICLIISHISANATDTLGAIMRCDTICSKVVIYTNESVEVCNIGGATHYDYLRFPKTYTLKDVDMAYAKADREGDKNQIIGKAITECISKEKIDSIKILHTRVVVSLSGLVEQVSFPILKPDNHNFTDHTKYLTSEDYLKISLSVKERCIYRTWTSPIPYLLFTYKIKFK